MNFPLLLSYREYPDDEAYKTPEYFTSDWLNEFCENQDDDYRFVYMGPKGTWYVENLQFILFSYSFQDNKWKTYLLLRINMNKLKH